MYVKAAFTRAFEYLDDLREAGLMRGRNASEFLAEEMGCEEREVRALADAWQDTFSLTRGIEERAQEAFLNQGACIAL